MGDPVDRAYQILYWQLVLDCAIEPRSKTHGAGRERVQRY